MTNSQKNADSEQKANGHIEIFRFADAEPLADKDMPMMGIDESVAAGMEKLMEAGAGEAGGETVTCLYRAPGESGLSLCYAWFKSGYVLPRHSHDADCLYYIIAGEIHLGKQVLGKGDGFFVPADAPYSYETGPEGAEVLEFRNATRFHFLFGNNSDAHWERMAKAYRERGPHWAGETVPPSEK